MSDYISKWHKELGIFSKIKPLIILEGNVLDSYQYPVRGSVPKGSILRLSEYLHFCFKDMGYQNIIFYDSLRGFYNTCEEGYLESFAKLVESSACHGAIKADFKGGSKNDGAANIVRKTLSQTKEASVVVMNFASRYIISPDNLEQSEVDSFTVLLQASLEAKDVKTVCNGILKNLLVLITNKSNLDKFLQILEDGRMTDGQGNTIYFSETIIIFTSNLGIFTVNDNGQREANVTSDMPYQEMSVRVREAIEDYFKLQLGRPEILNRIGENIVVFDYIRPEVAKLILNSQINKIIKNMSVEKHIVLTVSNSAMEVLTEETQNNLQNGGRGIRNVVENLLINPLSRYLFDNEIFDNASITIDNINTVATPPALECSRG